VTSVAVHGYLVGGFTLWLCQQFAIENGHRNSEFSKKKKVIFHSYVSLPEGIWLVVLTCFNHETHSSMGRNGKNYPIYHGKYTYPSEK